MSDAEELLIAAPDPAKWTTLEFAGGLRVNTLWEDPETGASIAMLDVPEGAGIPERHAHASNQFMYCLEGEYAYLEPAPGLVLTAGAFYMNPKGRPHGPTRAHRRSLLIEIYDGPHYFAKPDFHSDETVGRLSASDE